MGLPAGAGSRLFEAPIYTCSHCEAGVLANPLRTRDRPYCPKCDHIICDRCEAVRVASGGACKPYKQLIEELQEQAARDEQLEGAIKAAREAQRVSSDSVIILST